MNVLNGALLGDYAVMNYFPQKYKVIIVIKLVSNVLNQHIYTIVRSIFVDYLVLQFIILFAKALIIENNI